LWSYVLRLLLMMLVLMAAAAADIQHRSLQALRHQSPNLHAIVQYETHLISHT
jgi:hypothetical protein